MPLVRIARTIFALTLMLAVAGLPLAGAASINPAAAGVLGSSTVEMAMSDSAHDCCPKAEMPCGSEGCGGMATCATICIPWLAGASSRLDYGPPLAGWMAATPGDDAGWHLGDPPFRPPRI